jgi:hypothetical protein
MIGGRSDVVDAYSNLATIHVPKDATYSFNGSTPVKVTQDTALAFGVSITGYIDVAPTTYD